MRKCAWNWVPLAVILLGFCGRAGAEIYVYVDEHGVKTFTDRPKPNFTRVVVWEQAEPDRTEAATIYLDPQYQDIILDACRYYKVDPALIMAMIKVESNFNRWAVSPKGAQGLMQLMPATQARLRVTDPFHPVENIWAGVYYVKYLLVLFNYNYDFAIAGYNAGENAVIKYNGIPPYRETRAYVKRVNYYWALYQQQPPRFQAPPASSP